MVRDQLLDRTDGGKSAEERSGVLGAWEEVERLSSLGDMGRMRWKDARVYMHWVNGLGTRIDWILMAECWGADVWKTLEVEWCP